MFPVGTAWRHITIAKVVRVKTVQFLPLLLLAIVKIASRREAHNNRPPAGRSLFHQDLNGSIKKGIVRECGLWIKMNAQSCDGMSMTPTSKLHLGSQIWERYKYNEQTRAGAYSSIVSSRSKLWSAKSTDDLGRNGLVQECW